MLQRWIPDPRGLQVLKLDLYNEATGTTHTGHFKENGAFLYGVDISYQITRQAKLHCDSGVRVTQGDVRVLPFRENSFDFIFSLGTLEHVQDVDQPAVMKELLRVLRPGGTCLLGVNNRCSLWLTPLLFELLEATALIRKQWGYEPTYLPGHLRRLFRDAGFKNLRGDGTLLFPKFLRVYDMWSAGRSGKFFRLTRPLKNAVLLPIAWGIEKLESWGILNYFADQTLTGGIK